MRWSTMKQYKLISLVICFVVLIVLTNPLVAQSKYRQVNPYNNAGQLNPYKTYKVDRVDNDRASQYSKMQSKYINNEDSNINDFYNYNTGSVTYKTNLYDTDHFGRNDELGRKYDKYYDYEAGNPIYKKDVYNTDYFVRTDNFGNKYTKDKDGWCMFLKKGKVASCLIYNARPKICRLYPTRLINGSCKPEELEFDRYIRGKR